VVVEGLILGLNVGPVYGPSLFWHVLGGSKALAARVSCRSQRSPQPLSP